MYRVSAQDMVQCVVNRLLSCPLVCGFVSGALRWVTLGRTPRLPAERSYPTQWHTWEVGGGGRFESRRLCNARVSCFASHCACACRACVSETLETRRAVAPTCYGVPCVCTGYGAVRGQPSAVVSTCVWLCVWGAALGNARKNSTPPNPKG